MGDIIITYHNKVELTKIKNGICENF